MRQKREAERRRDPNRDQLPSDVSLPPDSQGTRLPTPTGGTLPSSRRPTSSPDDSISNMLDLAYATADQYLTELAVKTGGKLVRADTLSSLPDAFSKIAAELRTQYVLGYYPLNKTRDDRYRKIKVTTTRKGAIVRARPGYLATNAR